MPCFWRSPQNSETDTVQFLLTFWSQHVLRLSMDFCNPSNTSWVSKFAVLWLKQENLGWLRKKLQLALFCSVGWYNAPSIMERDIRDVSYRTISTFPELIAACLKKSEWAMAVVLHGVSYLIGSAKCISMQWREMGAFAFQGHQKNHLLSTKILYQLCPCVELNPLPFIGIFSFSLA